jgi:inner membrane transporter RhtA
LTMYDSSGFLVPNRLHRYAIGSTHPPLRRLPTRLFGVLMSLEPAIGAILGLVILDQSLSVSGVLAIALVVGASAGVTLSGPSDEAAIPLLVD